MLLDDERHVIKWLSQYGALTKTQVIRLLRDKTPETAEKILRNLKREHQISDVAGGYYLALDGLCKPDQRTILAVWVLLRFIDYVDPMAHYPAVYPSQIFFLKENTGYEIVVLYDGEQHLTLLAQVLTNVIISNTSEGKGDHFWDNGEANLLKALVLYIDLDRSRSPETKNLAAAYQLLTQNSERQLTALFEKLPLDHPARAPFNLFSQASDTVRSGIVLGLGTRLQVLQNEAVRDIISRSDIDLTAPGKRKCAYFVILSDQDATMAFLSSLFFSFLFIKLVRYADSTPELRCKVPVSLIFDEFNNVGKLGGAADGSDFARTLSVIRSRAIYVMLAVQSLGQLQNRYPNNLWAEIVGNLDVQLMLGCTDEVSAEYFSARSGDMSVEINSTMTVRKTIAVAQVIPQYRQTEGQGRRRLLTPDEVLRIPNEELLVVIRGHNVLKLKKFDYADHPLAKELTPVSILDYTPPHAAAPFLQTETTLPRAAPEERPHTSSMPSKRRTLYSSAKPPSEF